MKSRASGYLPFAEALLTDAARIGQASKVNVKRDLMTIKSRFEHEGLSFLTITLPDFAKAFDQALAKQQVDLSNFPAWKSWRCLPSFLRGFTCQVFDINTGRLLDDPSHQCIKVVRQICLCFKKLGLRCSRSREQKAIDRYIETERFIESFVPDKVAMDHFGRVADLIWGNMFRDFNHHDICPKHGPGAVVEKYTQNSKYTNQRWHSRLEPFFPADAFVYCNVDDALDRKEELIEIQEEEEHPVKVTLVPKTLKTPRIIAIEPCCMQYAQQGLAVYLVNRLENHWLTKGHVNFTDQSINQSLAMSASSDGKYATLDLSDASDRVTLSLVQRMLKACPDLLGALEASRSKAARLPSGEVIPLKKFASMGSAACFPIEAMVFYTITISSLLEKHSLPVTMANISKMSTMVYVYGDDIIVPTDMALAVADSLMLLGSKVNPDKSFYEGYFRESCGVDAYAGTLVTPVYLRATWPRDRRDAHGLSSLVATANQFYLNGFYATLLYLKSVVEEVAGPLPPVQDTCPGLGWLYPFRVPRSLYRFNRKYQVQQVLTWVPGPVYRVDTLDGWPALLKFFIRSSCGERVNHKASSPMGIDKDHLRRTPRYGTASLKRRWITPY